MLFNIKIRLLQFPFIWNTSEYSQKSIQNSAVRVVTLTGKRKHITFILEGLHWLPVEQRVIFKTLLITYKAR